MTKVTVNQVQFDLLHTYCPDTLDLDRVKEIEEDLQGYVIEVDQGEHVGETVDTVLYNLTGLEVRYVDYTEV